MTHEERKAQALLLGMEWVAWLSVFSKKNPVGTPETWYDADTLEPLMPEEKSKRIAVYLRQADEQCTPDTDYAE